MENNFASNFKHLRIQNGKTQEEIGKILNKDYSTIGKWELGQRSPTMEDVIKIAEYFNVSLQELICDDFVHNSKKNKEINYEKYKRLLKEKGFMDNDDNIDEEKLDKLFKIADMMKEMNEKR